MEAQLTGNFGGDRQREIVGAKFPAPTSDGASMAIASADSPPR